MERLKGDLNKRSLPPHNPPRIYRNRLQERMTTTVKTLLRQAFEPSYDNNRKSIPQTEPIEENTAKSDNFLPIPTCNLGKPPIDSPSPACIGASVRGVHW